MRTTTPNLNRSSVLRWLSEVGAESGQFTVLHGDNAPSTPRQPAVLDFMVEIELLESNRRFKLLIESKDQVHPKHVVSTLAPLAAMAHAAGQGTLAVLAASYISPRVSQVCRDHGVGYIDAAGNAHLAGPGLYVHIQGRPNLLPDTRPAERLFASKSSRIIRVMLEEPGRAWKVQDLARTAGVSIGLASRIKQKLVEQAFALETSDGVRIAEPAELLRQWTEVYQLPRHRVMVYSVDGPATVEQTIIRWGAEHDVPCALAEFSAASRLAPMVRTNRSVLYVLAPNSSDVLERLVRDLSLKQVDSGPTAELWVTDDQSVFIGTRQVQGLSVVSPLQVYLDVRKNPGRGQEAADEIYRQFLAPRFAGTEVVS